MIVIAVGASYTDNFTVYRYVEQIHYRYKFTSYYPQTFASWSLQHTTTYHPRILGPPLENSSK